MYKARIDTVTNLFTDQICTVDNPYIHCKVKLYMKKMCSVIVLVILFWFPVYSIPTQEQFLRYGIYYGTSDSKEIRNVDWSQYDLMILYPGDPHNEYKNLQDSAFLILIQTMRNDGVRVFLRQDIGCEKDVGGLYYSRTDRDTWLDFKKREINIFTRYADGIFLDCVGPKQGGRVYGPQFGRDIQELVDYVHYNRGEVIIGDLWALMDWVDAGELDVIPYKADYVLFEGAWSLTPDQYSDDFDPLSALFFAKSHNFEVLGLDYGREEDRDRLMYCYCASRVLGFSGFYYSWDNFYEGVSDLNVPDLGLPVDEYTLKGEIYTREFQRGKVYVDFRTHRGWIEGEAAEEADVGGVLVVAGFLIMLYFKKRKN